MSLKKISRTFYSLADSETYVTYVKQENGRNYYKGFPVLPNQYYSLDNSPIYGNESVIQSLKSFTITKTYSKALEDKLKTLGIEYKIQRCGSCGGRAKKIEYCPLVVTE